MMEPRVQYAQTADGVSIAFWTLGEGPALVCLPASYTHIQLEWQIAGIRAWYERLAQARQLVRFDWRGWGLSQRDVPPLPSALEWGQLDLGAVVDGLELERFSLFGPLHGAPVALAYAVRHPERVTRLVLWTPYARADEWTASPQIQAIRSLAGKDWETYTDTAAHLTLGWSVGDEGRKFAALIRESATPETIAMFVQSLNEVDVTQLLPQVRVPTLVLHRRQIRQPGVDVVTNIASRIPQARLVLLEGMAATPYLEEVEAIVAAIDEFLGEEEKAAPTPSGLVTILFTDMESSTALTQRLGDAQAQELVRAHNTIVREALRSHGGSEIKHTGDGIMASFPTASGALECAIAIQRAVYERGVGAHGPFDSAQGRRAPLQVHIGLNAGEPVAEEQDLFGTAVQLARRICEQADGGEIFVANVVRELAAGKGFLFSDRGDATLRGFEDPVRLWEVRWREG